MNYVYNLTNLAEGGTAIADPRQYINHSAMAEGLVGGELPVPIFYYPVLDNSPYLPPNAGSRYWTMIAAPTADMQGSREQSVWFRYQQVACKGASMAPPCEMVGSPQYWDTYWWSRFPGATKTDADHQTLLTGPTKASSAAGFYKTLIETRRWWTAELAAEGMMQLSLPSPASTNGTWLHMQARHHIIEGMITWNDK